MVPLRNQRSQSALDRERSHPLGPGLLSLHRHELHGALSGQVSYACFLCHSEQTYNYFPVIHFDAVEENNHILCDRSLRSQESDCCSNVATNLPPLDGTLRQLLPEVDLVHSTKGAT